MTWDPEQYLRFSGPRLRPAVDLIARVPLEQPAAIYDLGCGTGNVTRLLAARWPEAAIVGVDDSAAMLQEAAAHYGGIRWETASIGTWRAIPPADLVFSNAALHWLPDHHTLVPRLMDSVGPDGVLAIQMPRNFSSPSHTLIAETVREGRWRDTLEPLMRPIPVRDPAFYHAVLKPYASDIDIWETEYLHALEGTDPVKEWTKGTWLKPLLDALAPEDRADFEADYAARLRAAYPPTPSGTTLFPFRRLFIVARRSGPRHATV